MRSILFFICLIFILGGQAQEEEEFHMWKVELLGTLNNNSVWEVEPPVTYLPIPYVEIIMGLLLCDTVKKDSYTGFSRDNQRFQDSDESNPGRHSFALRPAIQLVTPTFKFGKDRDVGLSSVVPLGLTILLLVNQKFNISYISNTSRVWISQKFDHIKGKGGKSSLYHIKSMLSLDIDRQYTFSLGYILSNFDLYGGGRNFVVEGKGLSMPRIRFMYSFFLSIGYRL